MFKPKKVDAEDLRFVLDKLNIKITKFDNIDDIVEVEYENLEIEIKVFPEIVSVFCEDIEFCRIEFRELILPFERVFVSNKVRKLKVDNSYRAAQKVILKLLYEVVSWF